MSQQLRSWLPGFLSRAREIGISPELLDRFQSTVCFQEQVASKEESQAELILSIGEYLDRTVSIARIASGRAKFAEHSDLLEAIGGEYRVDPSVLAAIWGLESSYGMVKGDVRVIDALATLACTSRRKQLFERELVAALEIIESGAIESNRMTGSWAGAMGHTQFMPSSYLSNAISCRGSGPPDLWGDDPADALASTANYLSRRGWNRSMPWGFEVSLCDQFDFMQTGQGTANSSLEWIRLGVCIPDGFTERDIADASVLLPAGKYGPAILVTPNFRVLLSYNRAVPYALAAGMLADRIAGNPEPPVGWSNSPRPLSRTETRSLQQELVGLGYDTGGVDGLAGPATHAAVQQFQRSIGLVPDGFADQKLLERLRLVSKGRRTD